MNFFSLLENGVKVILSESMNQLCQGRQNMSGCPTPNDFMDRGEDSSYVIINGRRVPIGNGIHGRDLAKMAGPGRRPVKVGFGGAQILDSNRYYQPSELCDKRGRPVKISSMPDRTKGGFGSAERTLVFLDYANINAGAQPFRYLDYGDLVRYLGEGRFLVEAYAYVPIDPRNPDGRRNMIRNLQENGWLVYQKMGKIAGDSYKSNVDVEMCIDIMRCAQQIKPDIIVLCSGDGDFVPIARELRRMGIRVEAASFEQCADQALCREASGFISLDVWLEERDAENTADPEGRQPFADRADVAYCENSEAAVETQVPEPAEPEPTENAFAHCVPGALPAPD